MTNAEKLKELGLPEDFETSLTDEEQYLWLTTKMGDLRQSAERKLAEAAQLEAVCDYLGPIWRNMPEGTPMCDAIAEAKRRNPGDFVDTDTVRLPSGSLLRLR